MATLAAFFSALAALTAFFSALAAFFSAFAAFSTLAWVGKNLVSGENDYVVGKAREMNDWRVMSASRVVR